MRGEQLVAYTVCVDVCAGNWLLQRSLWGLGGESSACMCAMLLMRLLHNRHAKSVMQWKGHPHSAET